MHDHVSKIDENPGPVGVAFDTRDAVAVAPGCFDDGVGNCASLDLRPARDDRKRIGKNGSTAHVERNECFTLFVERAIANDLDQLADAGASVRARRRAAKRKVSRIAAVRSRIASSQSSPRSGKVRPGSRESAR